MKYRDIVQTGSLVLAGPGGAQAEQCFMSVQFLVRGQTRIPQGRTSVCGLPLGSGVHEPILYKRPLLDRLPENIVFCEVAPHPGSCAVQVYGPAEADAFLCMESEEHLSCTGM